MKNEELIQDIDHVDVTSATPAIVTYNFDRSVEQFIKIFKESYTDPDGTFFVEPACHALTHLSEAIMNNRDGVVLLDSKEATHNLLSIIHENPTIIQTLESAGLMDMLGKYMARTDINKPNGDFNPLSIFNCAKEDFGLDLMGKLPVPEYLVTSFLEKL